MTMRVWGLALAMLAASGTARAAEGVALSSTVFVEKTVQTHGRSRTVLEPPRLMTPGDTLVFVLSYTNRSGTPASDVVVTNPMPRAVAFQSAGDRPAQVSVDGGRSWGRLSDLTVREGDGTLRGARPEDVTHVRWTFDRPIPAGRGGRLTFRGVVRRS